MLKMHITKSVDIAAPIEKIFSILNDFSRWRPWSPWMIQDPDASNTVAVDGKFNEWEGNRVGSGNMRIISESANESIQYDLVFLKPWKSTANVEFKLKPNEGGTKVIWSMNSRLPLFLFWMKKMMEAMVGMDYQRGLNMLKDFVEDGQVHSKLDFVGSNDYPGCQYIGIMTQSSMDKVGEDMSADMQKIGEFIKQAPEMKASNPFSTYHQFGFVNRKVDYTCAVPVQNIPENLPEGFVSGKIPATKVYTLRHIGPYHHLGNAWTTLHTMSRNKEFKMNKRILPFESYVNDPHEVSENDLVTEVHFPIK